MADSFHTVTNRDVWDSLQAVHKTLNRIDGTLNSLDNNQKSHSEKIRALEVKYYGVIAGLIGAIGLIGAAFVL